MFVDVFTRMYVENVAVPVSPDAVGVEGLRMVLDQTLEQRRCDDA
jgi:hypothetical protein